MRFWDRLTGGAAEVAVELDKPMYMPNDVLRARVTISSDGEFEAKSALVTLRGQEEIRYTVPRYDDEGNKTGTERETDQSQTVKVEERVPGPIRLAEGQREQFEVELHIPMNAPPTYQGRHARHHYRLRVGLDVAWSADPSEVVDVVIGLGGPGASPDWDDASDDWDDPDLDSDDDELDDWDDREPPPHRERRRPPDDWDDRRPPPGRRRRRSPQGRGDSSDGWGA